MNFEEFLNKAWTDHATQAEQVAEHIPTGFSLLEKPEHNGQFAQLITHVFGEHLGRWQDGIELLGKLKLDSAVILSIATLQIASGAEVQLSHLSLSDQARCLATAAGTVAGQKQLQRTKELLQSALALAVGLTKEDPANRAIAVTGNNLASSLEEKSKRSPEEDNFMIEAAKIARKYWGVAGTWLEVERAEYRLAISHLKAGLRKEALMHAQNCLQICETNNAEPLEFFFAYECLARVTSESAKENFGKLSDADKSWCKESLDKLH